MIVDSFEIDGEEADIHIVDNKAENCFCILAKNHNNQLMNGFEFRIKKVRDMDVETFSKCAAVFAIVSFMRRQLEENHWDAYREDCTDAGISGAPRCASAREQGREAFMNEEHYSNNPFTDLNMQAHDEWDRGWAEEAQKNPNKFDFSIDSFQKLVGN
jgi:hypothetical protein